MRNTQMASLEPQWKHRGRRRLGSLATPKTGAGWSTKRPGGPWAFGVFDDFQLSYSLYSLVLASCEGSNLDVEKPIVFRENAAGFGQTVVQFGASR